MATLLGLCLFLLKLYADGGYQGPAFQAGLRRVCRCLEIEIVKRSDQAKGFTVMPNAGSWSERLPGSTAAGALTRVGNAPLDELSSSSSSPRSAS